MKNGHTSGPWKIQAKKSNGIIDEDQALAIVCDNNDTASWDVAAVWLDAGNEHGGIAASANASLIAAAPDLLAALEECERVMMFLNMDSDNGSRFNSALAASHAAIAKAKGGAA